MKPMTPKRTRRLRARAATMHAPEEEFEDYGPEPNMKLSHAFLAVLLLHVVAVGGLYAFNSMKAGKSSTAKTARSTEPVASQKQPSNDQDSDNTGGSGSGPSGEPPAPSKAPLVAKVSEAPKAVKAATESVARQTKQPSTATTAPRGILASAKSMIGKTLGASGIGAAAVSTSSAQEPATSTSPASQAPQPSRVTALSGIPATANTYMVKAGDTLTRIASSLGVAIPELEKVNGMTEKSVLQVGQILKVPTKVMSQAVSDVSAQAGKVVESVQQAPAAVVGAVTSVTSATTALTGATPAAGATAVAASVEDQGPTTEYAVVKGDSPYKIAKKFKITPDQLMKANGITDPKKIQIGQMLKIPSSAALSNKAAQ